MKQSALSGQHRLLLCWCLLCLAVLFPREELRGAETAFVTIATGPATGVYYPTGGAIARILNRSKKTNGFRTLVKSTAGSVENINGLLTGDFDFAIAQTDRVFQAYNGLAEWSSHGPQTNLRVLCALYTESVVVLAAQDKGIVRFEDLQGKIVNTGERGSGQRQNARDIFAAYRMDPETDIIPKITKTADAPGFLQDGLLDAFFYTVAHPARTLKEATAGRRKTTFLNIFEVEPLLKKYPWYIPVTYSTTHYPNAEQKGDIQTVGVKALLVTSAGTPQEVVYMLMQQFFSNLESFKKEHPAYSTLTPRNMLQGLPIPLHPGALEYFRDADHW